MSKEQSLPVRKNRNLRNHRLKKKIIIVAVAAIVVGGIAWAKFSGNNRSGEAEGYYVVKRGDLRISVLESGKIQARKSVTLTCEVEGQSTIISIVPEGTYVKEGDVLVELDSADLRQRVDQQEITVKSAESANTQATESFEIQKNQNESDIKAAQLKVEFAKIDLEKYTEGDWPQQKMQAENKVVTAKKEKEVTKDRLDGTIALHEKGYVTETDLKRDTLDYERAEIAVREAENAQKLLVDYDYKKQIAKLTADYEEAQKQLERARRLAASQLAQKQADLDAKKATYLMQKSMLEKHKYQLAKTIVEAPQAGLVIYASSSGERWMRDRGLIAEGEKVYERQKMIELPDVTEMKVNVSVHESVRDTIKAGQEATITVEAVPGLTLHGHVEKVAILPSSEQQWLNPDLTLYPTTVIIDDKSEAIKPGMTAKAEIIIADLKNVLYVPVPAVSVRDEREVCFAVRGSSIIATPVEVGLSNDNYIEIKSGLKEGDKVLTYAPIAAEAGTDQRKRREAQPEKERERAKETPTEEPPVQPREGEEMLKQVPEEMKEKAKAFLENLTPEQRKQLEEKLRELGKGGKIDLQGLSPEKMRELGPRLRRPPGEPSPEGGAPTGPRRPGRSRPEGRPREPGAGPDTERNRPPSGS